MTELPASEQIDGDDEIVPLAERERGLVPGSSCFFIALAVLILAMGIAALLKQMS
ncbi:hypothetical protein GCM10009087_46700 [Sphingomonas oligophenolica]|uniref:Uncharacterized protein n=1 Tax=Sphingomonas oligophenolica TaxID=301154 RepID=A0ABU9Y9F5_9SPHN